MNGPAVRIGIVGAGYWGPNLIRTCAQLGVLDSVCDIDTAALEATQRLYPNVRTFREFGQLLARPIQAVVIAAPAPLHAEMCLQSIAAGKHVFVEKPLALTVEEGERVAQAAKTAGRLVFVGHVLIYHPAIRRMREMLDDGAIGRIWHMRSRRLSLGKLRTHEDVWWSFAPHDVALMLAIMGEEPSAVSASQTALRSGRPNDVAYADFQFASGRSAHIEVCWLDPEKSARLDVFGEHGALVLTDSRAGSVLDLRPFSISDGANGNPTVERGEARRIDFQEAEPLKLEVEAFLQAVRAGTAVETGASQGVAVLKALAMAEEAARGRLDHGALV